MEIKIKKLWGENAAELAKSAKNIHDDYTNNRLQAIVVSAMRSPEFNTTDNLIALARLIAEKQIDQEKVFMQIELIKQFHIDNLNQKLVCSKNKLIELITDEFEKLKELILYYIENKENNIIPNSWNDYSIIDKDWNYFSILWFWESVSCKLFSSVVDTTSGIWICSKSIDLSSIVTREELKDKTEKEIFELLSIKISNIVEEKIKDWFIPVVSWYMWFFENGIEKTIGRWYSDATAWVVTVWLSNKWYDVTLEIQKSVKWLLSSDPRILENQDDAKLIEKLDYLMAREITWDTWAQAKLLHHQALRTEVQEAWVKIHLFDPFSSEDGSRILPTIAKQQNSGVSFIWARKNVVFFSISSGKMFQKWILSDLFTIVKEFFSVDIVSASETEVSFTLDWCNSCAWALDLLKEKIKQHFHLDENENEFVEYVENKSLVFCVWQDLRDQVWLLACATKVLWENDINIEIVSQWRLQRAMVFWIDEKDMKKAVNLLHQKFIK